MPTPNATAPKSRAAAGAALLLTALFTATTEAALIARGSGLIYDDVLDITWTQDADLWGETGTWDEAVAWVEALSFAGFDGWRLASMSVSGGLPTGASVGPASCDSAGEAACRDNELGYMFYFNLGGSSGSDLTGDQGPFSGIQDTYWSGTAFSTVDTFAWDLPFTTGLQALALKSSAFSAWAVHDGDIGAVPLPGTLPLLLAPLLGWLGSRGLGRRRLPAPAAAR